MAVDNDFGAKRSQAFDDRASDIAAGAGDERDLAV
jgi:hypothetical protein